MRSSLLRAIVENQLFAFLNLPKNDQKIRKTRYELFLLTQQIRKFNQRVKLKEAEKIKMTVKEEETIKKRKAQHALEEIFQSEKKYVDKLNSIVEVSFFL